MSEKIPLTSIGELGLIFNADDYIKIRTDYRIIGELRGCLVSFPRDSGNFGLPAVFNYYEVRLLLEMEIAVLLDKSVLRRPPSEATKTFYDEFIQNQLKMQNELKKKNQRRELMHQIVTIEKKNTQFPSPHATEISGTEMATDVQIQRENLIVQVPTEHPFELLKNQSVNILSKPTLKYRIFRDLWQRGYSITVAQSFGGDFLIYPGDPIFYHASHVVHILNSDEIHPKQLICCGRLCVVVNKSCVFAYENKNNEIVYQTMEWQGYTDLKLYPRTESN